MWGIGHKISTVVGAEARTFPSPRCLRLTEGESQSFKANSGMERCDLSPGDAMAGVPAPLWLHRTQLARLPVCPWELTGTQWGLAAPGQ